MKTNSLGKLALITALGFGFASARADITTGLVAHYPLNGNASDFSGNKYNGTVYAATPASDRFGNGNGALNFDGNGDVVGIPAASINNLGSGTIAAWIKLSNSSGGTVTAKQRDSVNSWALFTVGYIPHTAGGTPGKLYFHPHNNTPVGTGVASSTSILPTGVWRHVAVSFTSASARIYINGQFDSSTSGNFSVDSNLTTTNSIGGWIAPPNAPHWFNGLIDDVRIYNRALSDADVQQLYSSSAQSPTISSSSQPQGVIQFLGLPAAFSVSAQGPVPLYYQWWKDGVKLTSKTASTLSFLSVTAADAGYYSVVVNNSFGSVTSKPARLAIPGDPTAGAAPPKVDCGPAPIASPGKDSLVFITHGWRKKIPNDPPDFEWVNTMASVVSNKLVAGCDR